MSTDTIPTISTIYQALYKFIFQYGLIVWGGCAVNVFRLQEVQQNLIVQICFDKKTIQGSTSYSYKEPKVLPVKCLYQQFSIIFSSSKIIDKDNSKCDVRRLTLMLVTLKKNMENIL